MKLIALTIFILCIATMSFGQLLNKETFLNEVINDFVDSTFPVFYMKREAMQLNCRKICFNSSNRMSTVCSPEDKMLFDTLRFITISDSLWNIKMILRARVPISEDEATSISRGHTGIIWSKEYAYRERGDGSLPSEGFIKWPAADYIGNNSWGRTLYQFSSPLFDSSNQFAIFSCIRKPISGWGCSGSFKSGYYLYQRVNGHWKKRYYFN